MVYELRLGKFRRFKFSRYELRPLRGYNTNSRRICVVLRAGFEPASLTLSFIREASILSAKRTLTGLYSVA